MWGAVPCRAVPCATVHGNTNASPRSGRSQSADVRYYSEHYDTWQAFFDASTRFYLVLLLSHVCLRRSWPSSWPPSTPP